MLSTNLRFREVDEGTFLLREILGGSLLLLALILEDLDLVFAAEIVAAAAAAHVRHYCWPSDGHRLPAFVVRRLNTRGVPASIRWTKERLGGRFGRLDARTSNAGCSTVQFQQQGCVQVYAVTWRHALRGTAVSLFVSSQRRGSVGTALPSRNRMRALLSRAHETTRRFTTTRQTLPSCRSVSVGRHVAQLNRECVRGDARYITEDNTTEHKRAQRNGSPSLSPSPPPPSSTEGGVGCIIHSSFLRCRHRY